jgi:hypothetical protein
VNLPSRHAVVIIPLSGGYVIRYVDWVKAEKPPEKSYKDVPTPPDYDPNYVQIERTFVRGTSAEALKLVHEILVKKADQITDADPQIYGEEKAQAVPEGPAGIQI